MKALLIDDDPMMRLLASRMFNLLECQALEATGGVEGESMAFELAPDIILLDIMMPDQDGYETCINLRAKGYTGTILLTSTLQETLGRRKAIEVGANAYVQKPVNRDTLKHYLETVQAS
jgi:CheY-like chemotaxis protein